MAKMTKTQLTNQKREEVISLFMEFLAERGEDVMRVSGNAFAFPSVDAENNELFVKIAVSIPRGDRSGEAYDAYEEAAAFTEHQEEVAANKAQRDKEKAIKAAKAKERREAALAKKEAEKAAKQKEVEQE